MIDNFKFKETDFEGQGITELPDRPNEAGMTSADLKARFDNIPKIVMALGKINNFFNWLKASGASDIGATPIKEGGSDKVQGILGEIQAENEDNTEARHTHDNKELLDTLDDVALANLAKLIATFGTMQGVSTVVSNTHEEIPTSKAVLDAMVAGGAGDMLKAIYDINGNGIVDNSERLGGELPEHYTSQTTGAMLYADLWTGNGPYSYTIEIPGVSSISFNAVLPDSSPTDEDYAEYKAADLTDGGQSEGVITILARGIKPTKDIPVRVTVIH